MPWRRLPGRWGAVDPSARARPRRSITPLGGRSLVAVGAVILGGSTSCRGGAVPVAEMVALPAAARLDAALGPDLDRRRDTPTPPGTCDWRITDEDVPVWRDEAGVERMPEPEVPSLAMHAAGGGVPRVDRFANVGACTASGTCRHVVLEGCGGGRFRAVWGPQPAVAMDVITVAGRNRIVVEERLTPGGCELPRRTILDWTGARWRPGPACALPDDVPADTRCRPRLPPCEPIPR